MAISDRKPSPLKAIAWSMLLLSMAAYGASDKPASLPAAVGATPSLAVYVLLHQTRYDSVPGDAGVRLGSCYEYRLQTAQRAEAR